MSAIDEIVGYQRNPDEDFYGMLNCNEHSTVSRERRAAVLAKLYSVQKGLYCWMENGDFFKGTRCITYSGTYSGVFERREEIHPTDCLKIVEAKNQLASESDDLWINIVSESLTVSSN